MKSFRLNSSALAIALTASVACALVAPAATAAVSVTTTTDSTALGTALAGSGVTITSANVVNGDPAQFGTYTNFGGSVINLGNGVVLSNGIAAQVADVGSFISNDMGVGGTPEFDGYGPGHITNFTASFDVAALQVNFTLASASAVAFSFVFGSMEFPDYVNNFTDAFLTFLDGTDTANQVVFDASNNPVQVGTSFASALTTADTSTAFTNPHGLVGVLTTTTGTLTAGSHTLLFEVGDVNDHVLDSAVFLTNLHATENNGGPITTSVPEPGTYALMICGLFGLAAFTRRRAS